MVHEISQLYNDYDNSNGSAYNNKEPEEFNRCRGCNRNLASNEPASQYQRQKIIQNTVRVQSSLYTMNLAALNAYHSPKLDYDFVDINGANYIVSPGVNWNQMSDRANPSRQMVNTGSGSIYRSSSTKHTQTSLRPGALSPGGKGVDIKHNSYDRYLNRLKGKGPLKRGIIPATYGLPIPFSRAKPIYGGKIIKTGIISGCDCKPNAVAETLLYQNGQQDAIYNVRFKFQVGDFVWAKMNGIDKYEKATIIDIVDGLADVQFENGVEEYKSLTDISIYFDCNCDSKLTEISILANSPQDLFQESCTSLAILANGEIL